MIESPWKFVEFFIIKIYRKSNEKIEKHTKIYIIQTKPPGGRLVEEGKRRLIARILVDGAVRGGNVDVEEEVVDFAAHLLGHLGELMAIRHVIVVQDEDATRANLAGGDLLLSLDDLRSECLHVDDLGRCLGQSDRTCLRGSAEQCGERGKKKPLHDPSEECSPWEQGLYPVTG